MGAPVQEPGLVLFEAGLPLLSPRRSKHSWHRRQDVVGSHVVGVVDQIDPLEQTTHVVDVIGVPIICSVDRDDRFEVWWTLTGHLE